MNRQRFQYELEHHSLGKDNMGQFLENTARSNNSDLERLHSSRKKNNKSLALSRCKFGGKMLAQKRKMALWARYIR